MSYHIAKVQGRGTFPIDMLRYDRCSPFRESDSAMMDGHQGERTVEVIAIREGANRNANYRPFCAERWQSFGWRIIDIRRDNP